MSDPRNPPDDGEDVDPGFIDDDPGGADLEQEPEPDYEPEPEPDEPEPDIEPDQQHRRRSRRDQNERLRIRLEKQDAELADLRRQIQNPQRQQPQFDPAQAARLQAEENERLAVMGPAEAARYFYEKGLRETAQVIQQDRFQTQDLLDRQAYETAARSSRVHQQYKQRVDDLLASERARGNLGANRDSILKYLVGQDAIERATRAAPGQRSSAARRVAGQTVRPGTARGDGARPGGERRGEADADERLLRRLRVGDVV
jgi:hypothetical protein